MEIYSIDIDKGVTIITKRDENFIKRKGEYSYTPDVFINPTITISDNGVLTISGSRHSYFKVRDLLSHYWIDRPTSHLVNNFRDILFVNEEEDLYTKDRTKWKGWFIFKLPKTEFNVQFIKCGWYLSKEGNNEVITTSNFRLVGHSNTVIKGQING
jgi:hypothetical protein